METPSTNGQLPKAWKTEFAKMRPLIPAVSGFLSIQGCLACSETDVYSACIHIHITSYKDQTKISMILTNISQTVDLD